MKEREEIRLKSINISKISSYSTNEAKKLLSILNSTYSEYTE
jgi:hypothetical protein